MDDPADVFCGLYDALTDRAMARDRRWDRNGHLRDLSVEVQTRAKRLELDVRWLRKELTAVEHRSGEGPAAARWAAARGIDWALAESNPAIGSPPDAPRSALKDAVDDRYDRTGRLDTGAVPGALLPKLVSSGRRGEQTASRAEAFFGVHRVPAAAWESDEVDFRPLLSKHQPTPRMRQGVLGVVAACSPMLAELDRDITILEREEDGARFFLGQPMAGADMEERVRTVLRRMDDSGAMVGICPELALSEPMLDLWLQAMRESDVRRSSTLQWVFLGSGPFPASTGDLAPNNRAVLVDRHAAKVIHEQDKLYPFTIMPDQIEDWGLSGILTGRADEFMTTGERLAIRETAWGRLAVVICEDLAKLLEPKVGRLVKDFGVSLLIAPVFSKEVQAYYWEHQQARVYAAQVGTRTVVANSLVVPRAAGMQGDVGTCLVNAPGGFELGRCDEADQIRVFWLTAQRVEVPATQPVATDAP